MKALIVTTNTKWLIGSLYGYINGVEYAIIDIKVDGNVSVLHLKPKREV